MHQVLKAMACRLAWLMRPSRLHEPPCCLPCRSAAGYKNALFESRLCLQNHGLGLRIMHPPTADTCPRSATSACCEVRAQRHRVGAGAG